MPFTPASPYSKDKLSKSQPEILGNFTAMNTIFGVDHKDFLTTTTNNGMHAKVTLLGNNPAIAIPVTASAMNFLCNWSGTNFTLNYVEHNGAAAARPVQMTSKVTPITLPQGNSFLPGSLDPADPLVNSMGIVMYWGLLANVVAGVNGPYAYSALGGVCFEGAPFSIILTGLKPSGSTGNSFFVCTDVMPTDSAFSVWTNAVGPHSVYYVAIGREKI